MTDNEAHMRQHIRLYIGVFTALAVATVLTVVASNLHVSPTMHLVVALTIAAAKALLVAAIFMHLRWEKTIVLWGVLIVTAIFLTGLIALPALSMGGLPESYHLGSWG